MLNDLEVLEPIQRGTLPMNPELVGGLSLRRRWKIGRSARVVLGQTREGGLEVRSIDMRRETRRRNGSAVAAWRVVSKTNAPRWLIQRTSDGGLRELLALGSRLWAA